MKSSIKSNKLVRISVIVLVVALTLTAVAAASSDAIRQALQGLASDNAFNETNPVLNFAPIQGNAESNKGESLYTHESSLEQGDGKYAITTNSYVEWFEQDDVAMAYKYYGVKTNKKDWIEMTCEVDYFSQPDGSAVDWPNMHNPSTGIEFRSSLENNASFFYLHLRNNGVMTLVYRDPVFTSSLFSCSAQENMFVLQESDYPVSMKISMSGTTFQASYKPNGADEWIECTAVKLNGFTGGVYAGLVAHSGSEKNPLVATFSNLNIQGEQSMNASEDGDTGVPTEPEVVDPDPVYKDADVLLSETFTDGALDNGTDMWNNPIWKNFLTLHGIAIKNVEGNRMLYSEYANGMDFIGSEKWTDYSASMDFMYDKEMVDEADGNVVGLVVRSVGNLFYGYQNYVVAVRGGNEVCIYKTFFQNKISLESSKVVATVSLKENILKDGRIHNLRADCFDDHVTVFLDGEEVLLYTDDGYIDWGLGGGMEHINSTGGIGVVFDSTFAYVDNFLVRKLEDPVGGSYDNSIGGNWDVEVPWYIEKSENS